jgi:hypothetical protein
MAFAFVRVLVFGISARPLLAIEAAAGHDGRCRWAGTLVAADRCGGML